MSVALITGASSGIGRATAEAFAAKGYDVVVLARRKELLDALTGELKTRHPKQRMAAFTCDITRWPEVAEVAKAIEGQFGALNVLINNAGAFEYASLEKSTPEKLDQLINVNVRGLAYVSKAMLPLLKRAASQGEWAKIVNVSSISGLWGFSNMSVYTATKFAVAGFSSGLRRELAGDKIRVATIFPGPVSEKAATEAEKQSLVRRKIIMKPKQVAKQILELALTTRNNLVSHPAFRVLSALESVSPELVDRALKRLI